MGNGSLDELSTGIKLKDIAIEDQTVFKKYLKRSSLWEHFFLYLLLNEVKWAEVNSTLCIFQKDFYDHTWQLQSLPIGEEPTVIKTLKEMIERKAVAKILFATEKDKELIERAKIKLKKAVLISEEFIYRVKDLVSLSGENYGKIRRQINFFKRSCQYELIEYDKTQDEKLAELLAEWREEKMTEAIDKDTAMTMEDDFKNSQAAFQYRRKIAGLDALLVKSDGKIIGAAVYGILNNGMAVDFVRKTLCRECRGITELLIHEVAKRLKTEFINSGGYGKSVSLRAHKLGLRPEMIVPIYKLYF